jgi:hypothetical protein
MDISPTFYANVSFTLSQGRFVDSQSIKTTYMPYDPKYDKFGPRFIGTYQAVTDLKDPNLLTTITQITTVLNSSRWQLVSAERQLITGGLNYIIIFQVNKTVQANVTAYVNHAAILITNLVNATYYPTPSPTVPKITPVLLSGGYRPITDI